MPEKYRYGYGIAEGNSHWHLFSSSSDRSLALEVDYEDPGKIAWLFDRFCDSYFTGKDIRGYRRATATKEVITGIVSGNIKLPEEFWPLRQYLVDFQTALAVYLDNLVGKKEDFDKTILRLACYNQALAGDFFLAMQLSYKDPERQKVQFFSKLAQAMLDVNPGLIEENLFRLILGARAHAGFMITAFNAGGTIVLPNCGNPKEVEQWDLHGVDCAVVWDDGLINLVDVKGVRGKTRVKGFFARPRREHRIIFEEVCRLTEKRPNESSYDLSIISIPGGPSHLGALGEIKKEADRRRILELLSGRTRR